LNQLAYGRRLRAHISEFGTTQLYIRNPWIVAFWSFAYPGCGNLMQGRVMTGLILVCWELFINTKAKVNLSIMYSLIGQFDRAKEAVNPQWFLLYVALYAYSIWDSYRGTVDLNKQYILSDREDAPVKHVTLKSLETNFFDKRSPLFSATLSILSPGLGHLYLHKVITGLFLIAWTILVMYMSHALPAVHYLLIGEISQSKSVVDMQWLMYLPSIYGFVIYDTYQTANEYNILFEKAQSQFLRNHYQSPSFKMPM